MSIIGVTGHRPHLLGGYDIIPNLVILAEDYLLKEEPNRVLTGMALGWDQAVALACIKHKIPFTAAVPFKGQELKWPSKAQQTYRHLLFEAHGVVYVSQYYTGYAMDKRNRWIVDNCDKLLALFSGKKGGTANCIEYAKAHDKPIDNLWDKYDLFRKTL